jgi:hypothetical protein
MDGTSKPHRACPGPLRRREFLRLGLGALTLPGLFRRRAEAAAQGRDRASTALLVVWLHGGASGLGS